MSSEDACKPRRSLMLSMPHRAPCAVMSMIPTLDTRLLYAAASALIAGMSDGTHSTDLVAGQSRSTCMLASDGKLLKCSATKLLLEQLLLPPQALVVSVSQSDMVTCHLPYDVCLRDDVGDAGLWHRAVLLHLVHRDPMAWGAVIGRVEEAVDQHLHQRRVGVRAFEQLAVGVEADDVAHGRGMHLGACVYGE